MSARTQLEHDALVAALEPFVAAMPPGATFSYHDVTQFLLGQHLVPLELRRKEAVDAFVARGLVIRTTRRRMQIPEGKPAIAEVPNNVLTIHTLNIIEERMTQVETESRTIQEAHTRLTGLRLEIEALITGLRASLAPSTPPCEA